jgi:hypothetical protein
MQKMLEAGGERLEAVASNLKPLQSGGNAMRKIAGLVLFGFMLLTVIATAVAEEKISGDFVVVSVAKNIVKAKNKTTGTRLPLEVNDKTVILHQGQHKGTLADIKKGDEFSGEYVIQGKQYIATRIDLK